MGQTSPEPLLIEVARAEGVFFYTPEGRRYYDLVSGVSVNNVGHANPEVVAAVQQQSADYMHVMVYGEMVERPQVQYARQIAGLLPEPLDSVYFVNSGSEAVEMVKLSQKAENVFVGVNCGIMDQFAVGMGKANSAILLDCNTLEYRYSPIALAGASIVITNTNKPHSLASSAYNVRRAQCEHALNELREVRPELKSLGELTNEEFDKLAGHISEHLERQRARHAVYENQRTLAAVKALEDSDVAQFGRLMNASHVSLRDDYDVTGKELDTLAELAWEQPGVIGSRMTGAGFGGCTVSLVKNEAIEAFKKNVGESYEKAIGYAPSFYVANIADGTHRL